MKQFSFVNFIHVTIRRKHELQDMKELTMKTRFTSTFILMNIFLSSNIVLADDFGPYYISYEDFCEVYEIYITPNSNIYGTEIGCERESVVVYGNYLREGGDPRIPLHYYAEGVDYIDIVHLRTGLSSLYYSDGSSMENIVESHFEFSNKKPHEVKY